MSDLIIRPMKKSEIPKVYNVIRGNYDYDFVREYDAKKELNAMFTTEYFKPKFLVGILDKKIIGVVGYCQSFMDFRFYEIFWVNIHYDYQRKGYGTKIMSYTINEIKKFTGRDQAKSIMLQTVDPCFYVRLGFETLYLFNNNDNCFMALNVH